MNVDLSAFPCFVCLTKKFFKAYMIGEDILREVFNRGLHTLKEAFLQLLKLRPVSSF